MTKNIGVHWHQPLLCLSLRQGKFLGIKAIIIAFLATYTGSVLCAEPCCPYQIIAGLWQCRLSDLDAYWSTCVSAYADLDDEHATLPQLYNRVSHCGTVHTFLSRLYVDELDDGLIYVDGRLYNQSVESLMHYWQRQGSRTHHLFYARYFDWLARCFIATIYQISACSHRSDQAADGLHEHADDLYARLQEVHGYLQGYRCEHVYARQLRRYQELRALCG